MNDDDRCRIPLADLRRSILPLRLVFWGGVLNVVDFTIRSDTQKFDVFSDLVGTTLVLVGLWKLASLRVDVGYRKRMLFAVVAAGLSLVGQLLDFASPAVQQAMKGFVELAGLLEVAAIAVFTLMMVRLAESAELPDVAADWKRTFKWFLFCFVAPLGLLRAGGALWVLAGRPSLPIPSFPLAFWLVAIVLFFAMLLVPWIRLFLSTTRLRNALQLKAWSRTIRDRRERSTGGPSAAGSLPGARRSGRPRASG